MKMKTKVSEAGNQKDCENGKGRHAAKDDPLNDDESVNGFVIEDEK